LNKSNDKKFKSKLYFLGNPRDLRFCDVRRHVCMMCQRAFHFPLALEWHITENHNQHLGTFQKTLDRISKKHDPVKIRVLPPRLAAPRGAKRFRLQLEEEEIKKEVMEIGRDTYSDIDALLEDSSSDEEDQGEYVRWLLRKESRVMALKINIPIKACQVRVEKLPLRVNIGENSDKNNGEVKVVGSSSDSDIEIKFLSDESDDGSDVEVVFISGNFSNNNDGVVKSSCLEGAPLLSIQSNQNNEIHLPDDLVHDLDAHLDQNEVDVSPLRCNEQDVDNLLSQEIIDLSLSSHSPSSQPSHWTAPEEVAELDLEVLPKLSQADDKVTWWLSTVSPELKKLND